MSNMSTVGGELKTSAELITAKGKRINLGVLDNRAGITMNIYGKKLDLTYPWTPRLWFYKYVTYRLRNKKEK